MKTWGCATICLLLTGLTLQADVSLYIRDPKAGDWFHLDLTPALDASLFANNLHDQGHGVQAAQGMEFLLLPVRYDRTSGPQTLSKSTLRGKDMKGFYSLRILSVREGRVVLATADPETFYERIELKPVDEGRPKLIARNSLGPRRIDNEGPRQERLRERPKNLRVRGWLGIVLEVDKSAKRLKFQAEGQEGEMLDLAFIREARANLDEFARRDPRSGAMSRILRSVRGPSRAMAALAIGRLGRIRDAMGPDVPDAWTAAVDAAVIAAGAGGDEGIQAAAWSYFATGRSIPETTIRHLADQPGDVQRGWVQLVRCGLGFDRCGHVWPPIGLIRSRTPEQKARAAAALLGGIMRSSDRSVCSAALDVLIELGDAVDWSLLGRASEVARSLVLSRLETMPDEDYSVRLLVALIPGVEPQMAAALADRARQMELRLSDPNDPVLREWDSLSDPVQRAGLLTVLQAVRLGDVLYSRRFARMIREALAPTSPAPVREAAFGLLIKQARFQTELNAGSRAAPLRTRPFPVLVLDDPARRDPLFAGLAEAVRRGSRATRLTALEALLAEGYAEEAARDLAAGAADDAERNAILNDLLALPTLADAPATLAMLGHLLRPEYAASSRLILSHLSRVIAQAPASDRWRLLAAVKSGIHFGKLTELGSALRPPTAGAVDRWLHELGHLTIQDQQRLAAAREPQARQACLCRIDYRRGFLVDGRYGALAVVETVVAEDAEGGRQTYHAPRRVTVVLPGLVLESNVDDEYFRVLWDKNEIGRGRILQTPPRLKGPTSYYPALRSLPGSLFTGEAPMQTPPPGAEDRTAEPVGPLVLPSLPVLTGDPPPGKMTLEIGPYLRQTLRAQETYGDDVIESIIPESLKITLRYAAFGGYCGVGVARELPATVSGSGTARLAGQRRLLNVMLILERID